MQYAGISECLHGNYASIPTNKSKLFLPRLLLQPALLSLFVITFV